LHIFASKIEELNFYSSTISTNRL